MKKSLVLAMAMALGVTASAYAANPFSDVPAGSWAYDSVAKLAAAGVVDGYPDGTFRGNRLMTRYEMAQIVAKAMAKGANVDRLAAEFADELDALGVRVSTLEAKQDNVKVTGEVTAHYANSDKKAIYGEDDKTYEGILESNLYVDGTINDDWGFTAQIQNEQDITGNNEGDEDTAFIQAFVAGRLGGMDVTAGRQSYDIADGDIWDDEVDAVNASYGDKYVLNATYGKNDVDYFWAASLETNMDSPVAAKVGYAALDKYADDKDNNIWYGTLEFAPVEDLALTGTYMKSDVDVADGMDDDGYIFGLGFKGAEAEEVGSWGLEAKYYHQADVTMPNRGGDGYFDFDGGFKGYSVGAEVTLAKNVTLGTTYYETKALKGESDKEKVLYTELGFVF